MSDRNTYYSGSLKIELEQTGISKDGRDVFKGTIILTDGRRHDFDDLGSGCGGCGTEISMAESAISFASYYSSDNRGGDGRCSGLHARRIAWPQDPRWHADG